jgi:hypothetical protein
MYGLRIETVEFDLDRNRLAIDEDLSPDLHASQIAGR